MDEATARTFVNAVFKLIDGNNYPVEAEEIAKAGEERITQVIWLINGAALTRYDPKYGWTKPVAEFYEHMVNNANFEETVEA